MIGDAMAAFTVQLLAEPRVRLGDTTIPLGAAQQRAVFSTLALRAGQVVTRDELIAAVWGDEAPASAPATIYTYVSALRGLLRPLREHLADDPLGTSRAGYVLRVPAENVDAHRFLALREQAKRARNHGDLAGESAALRSALALWCGPALHVVPGPFASAQRDRLTELRITASERLAEIALSAEAYDDAVTALAPLVDQQPLREHLQGLHMLALAGAGRRADALAAFERVRAAIAEQSGLDPGPGLMDVHRQVSAEDGGRLHDNLLHLADPSSTSSLVGRENEVATVRGRAELLDVGRGGGLWLEGAPGSGKTTAITVALSTVDAQVRVLWSRADELTGSAPFALICDWLGIIPDASMTAEKAAEQARRYVVGLCARGPHVLVFEDVHWSDDESLRVLHSLHQLTESLPLLLIASARPAPPRPELIALRTALSRATGVVRLGDLTHAQAEVVAAQLSSCPPAPNEIALMVRLTSGNPALLKEVYKSRRRANQNTGSNVYESCPPVADLARSHLAILPPCTRRMLATCALLGEEFSLRALELATAAPAQALMHYVNEAISVEVLERAGDRLRFRTPLVREVCRDETPAALRTALHQELAAALAADGAPPEEVAEQLLAAPPVTAEAWVPGWLLDALPVLTAQAPDHAANLLRMLTGEASVRGEFRDVLLSALARLLVADDQITSRSD